MHRRKVIGGLAATAASSAAAPSAWSNSFARRLRDDFLAHWEVEKQYSLEILEAMPAEHFQLRPTPEQRSFAEQVAHYIRSNISYFKDFGKLTPLPRPAEEINPATLRAYLVESYDYVAAVLSELTENDFVRRDIDMGRTPVHTAQDVFLRAYMHSAHHRGSAVVYLRLAGIQPPRWRFPAQGDARQPR